MLDIHNNARYSTNLLLAHKGHARVILLHQIKAVLYKTQEQAIVEDTGLNSISMLDL
jgi:hypothetical protein